MLAVGGTEKMHRTLLSSVLRGHGPGDAAAEVSLKKMLRKVEAVLDAKGKRDNEKRGYAAHWWKNYLLICDWLPNEARSLFAVVIALAELDHFCSQSDRLHSD